MTGIRFLQIIYIDFFASCCVLMSSDHSLFSKKSFDNENRRHKRHLSIKNYFIDRYCIKYSDTQRRFRFDGQSGQIDIDGKLHVVVSSVLLNNFSNQYEREVYNRIPLYFLTVNLIIH